MNENKKQIVRFAKVIQVDANGDQINSAPETINVVKEEKKKVNPINILLIMGIVVLIITLLLFIIFYVMPRI